MSLVGSHPLGARRASALAAIVVVAAACTNPATSTPVAARCRPAARRWRRRAPIHALVSRRACGMRARRRGTSSSSPRRGRPRNSSARRIRISRSLVRTRSRAVTTDTRSGTSATRPIRRSKSAFFCPASQSDVSVYRNLLFVSAEAGRRDSTAAAQGVSTAVSQDRIRGVRIFDITDIANPKYVGNVQTCRGSHTHTVLVDPKDPDNVYVYISGSSASAFAEELSGCSSCRRARIRTRRSSASRSSRFRSPIRRRRRS